MISPIELPPPVDLDLFLSSSQLTYVQSEDPCYKDSIFGEVRDLEGNSVGFLRDSLADDFLTGLRALQSLGEAGVNVARHKPIVTTSGEELLLVEYIDGSTLDKVGAPDRTVVKLAVDLATYFAKAIRTQEAVILGDIVAPFQHKIKDDNPVLIDLDMHYYTPIDPERRVATARLEILDVIDTYGDFLTDRSRSAEVMYKRVQAILDGLDDTADNTDYHDIVSQKAEMGRGCPHQP